MVVVRAVYVLGTYGRDELLWMDGWMDMIRYVTYLVFTFFFAYYFFAVAWFGWFGWVGLVCGANEFLSFFLLSVSVCELRRGAGAELVREETVYMGMDGRMEGGAMGWLIGVGGYHEDGSPRG